VGLTDSNSLSELLGELMDEQSYDLLQLMPNYVGMKGSCLGRWFSTSFCHETSLDLFSQPAMGDVYTWDLIHLNDDRHGTGSLLHMLQLTAAAAHISDIPRLTPIRFPAAASYDVYYRLRIFFTREYSQVSTNGER
jgi:hypothetical protein